MLAAAESSRESGENTASIDNQNTMDLAAKRRLKLVQNACDNLCLTSESDTPDQIAPKLHAIIESLQFAGIYNKASFVPILNPQVRRAFAKLYRFSEDSFLNRTWYLNSGLAILLLMALYRFESHTKMVGGLDPQRILNIGAFADNVLSIHGMTGGGFIPEEFHEFAHQLNLNPYLVALPKINEPVSPEDIAFISNVSSKILSFASDQSAYPVLLSRGLQSLCIVSERHWTPEQLDDFLTSSAISKLAIASRMAPLEVLRVYLSLCKRGDKLFHRLIDPDGSLRKSDEPTWRRLVHCQAITLLLAQGAPSRQSPTRVWLSTDLVRVLWRDHLSIS